MPDLPNMGQERDIEGFREFFSNPNFRTDGLKVANHLEVIKHFVRSIPPSLFVGLAYMNFGKLENTKTTVPTS